MALSSCESMVDNLVAHGRFANNYHNFIIQNLFCDESMNYWMELYRDIRQGNLRAIKNELGLIDWLELFLDKNADEMWLVFTNKPNEVA